MATTPAALPTSAGRGLVNMTIQPPAPWQPQYAQLWVGVHGSCHRHVELSRMVERHLVLAVLGSLLRQLHSSHSSTGLALAGVCVLTSPPPDILQCQRPQLVAIFTKVPYTQMRYICATTAVTLWTVVASLTAAVSVAAICIAKELQPLQ